jgi:integrase
MAVILPASSRRNTPLMQHASSVKAPQPRRAEIRPLDREQVRALFKAASGHRLEALFVVAVTAGLRQGELLGLRWEDVGLEAGMV